MSKEYQALPISRLAEAHNTLGVLRVYVASDAEAWKHIVEAQQSIEAAIAALATMPESDPDE